LSDALNGLFDRENFNLHKTDSHDLFIW
jgi:hypothetical protein